MFLLNKLNHTLTLKQGYLKINANSTNTQPLSEEDFKDATIVDAISRGWAAKSDVQVTAEATSIPETSIVNPKGGITEAELKAQLANKVEKPAAITTELGKEDGIPQGGAEGSKIGGEANVVIEAPEAPTATATTTAAKTGKAGKTNK